MLFILACLFVWMLVYSGTFFRLWLERHRNGKDPEGLPEKIRSGTWEGHLPLSVVRVVKKLTALKSGSDEVAVVNLLRDAEHGMWKSLDSLKMVIRIGPGLGLIGTLIPMGTGLASLGQGDLGQLSQDLVVAFTTTVVGMPMETSRARLGPLRARTRSRASAGNSSRMTSVMRMSVEISIPLDRDT